MYEHEIEAQVQALKKAGVITGSDVTKARKTLKEHWSNKIAVVWMESDVLWRAAQIGKKVPKEDAASILEAMLDNHDANYGICWETFDYYMEDYEDMTEEEQEKALEEDQF